MKAVLDSNVVVEVLKEKFTLERVFERYEEVNLTAVGMGELFYGAYHSTQVELHLAECIQIQSKLPILTIDDQTSRTYGVIKQELRQKGKMIPENDIWIAAIALTTDSVIVTKDQHFTRISNLQVELV